MRELSAFGGMGGRDKRADEKTNAVWRFKTFREDVEHGERNGEGGLSQIAFGGIHDAVRLLFART